MLAVAAIAFATTTQTYKQSYTSKKKNTSVGTKFKTQSTEDQNAENNHQPKSTRQFDITFPAGTKIDTKTVPGCTLDESAAQPCPNNTKVGSGHAVVLLPFTTPPANAPINATVTAYNRKGTKGLILYVQPSVGNPVYLKPVFKGLKLKTAVPPTCIASTNQNGQCVTNTGGKGQEAVLTEFDLTTKAIKKGKRTFLKSPPNCPKSGKWKFAADIKYADGTKKHLPATSPCKK
jgi:hypothetical protein